MSTTENGKGPMELLGFKESEPALAAIRLKLTARELQRAADYAHMQAEKMRLGLIGDDMHRYYELRRATQLDEKALGVVHIQCTWEG